MEEVNLKFKGGMQFTANVSGFEIELDGPEEFGGANVGPRPKPLLLAALAGCTGMDIASLAVKMRVTIKDLDISVVAHKSEDTVPMIYTSATIIYKFEGDLSDSDKIIKMVTLSQDRYCGVSFMLRKAFDINFIIYLNNEQIL